MLAILRCRSSSRASALALRYAGSTPCTSRKTEASERKFQLSFDCAKARLVARTKKIAIFPNRGKRLMRVDEYINCAANERESVGPRIHTNGHEFLFYCATCSELFPGGRPGVRPCPSGLGRRWRRLH